MFSGSYACFKFLNVEENWGGARWIRRGCAGCVIDFELVFFGFLDKSVQFKGGVGVKMSASRALVGEDSAGPFRFLF